MICCSAVTAAVTQITGCLTAKRKPSDVPRINSLRILSNLDAKDIFMLNLFVRVSSLSQSHKIVHACKQHGLYFN